MPSNDLADFMNHATQEIENEYIRIQKRATEDPGTAGDQGEENWASLLRNWLPPVFQIVTKGRILSDDGTASPQVDIIVLQPEYPKQLVDKKLYLAGGIIAAFECKLTLKAKHIENFIINSIEIKKHIKQEFGTPYKELHSPILYGLLAHSHCWRGDKTHIIDNLKQILYDTDLKLITHPFMTPDIICIADLATWINSKVTFIGPSQIPDWKEEWQEKFGPYGSATSTYICRSGGSEFFTPIGAMITALLHKIAWQYPNLRSIAKYFNVTNIKGSGGGMLRPWDISIYSKEIRQQIQKGELSNGKMWDEWSLTFL